MNLATIPDAAKQIGIHESKLRRAVRDGSLPAMPLGNRQIVDVDAARALFAEDGGMGIKEISDATGLTVSAIRRAVREEWMPCRMIGKKYVFQLEDVQEAICRRMKPQTKR